MTMIIIGAVPPQSNGYFVVYVEVIQSGDICVDSSRLRTVTENKPLLRGFGSIREGSVYGSLPFAGTEDTCQVPRFIPGLPI